MKILIKSKSITKFIKNYSIMKLITHYSSEVDICTYICILYFISFPTALMFLCNYIKRYASITINVPYIIL